MNWFNRDKDTEDYPLSAAEDARSATDTVTRLLYLVLGAVVVITAAHAILLVINTTGSYEANGGLFGMVLNVIRVAFPVVVELAAVAVCLGFVRSKWRGGQRSIGSSIETAWLLFAAANMITFFALERGEVLAGWQLSWVRYGLPLSALIVSSMTYRMLKADPDHKRDNEVALATERRRNARFNARQGVMMSDAMMTIEERKVWRETVHELAAQGYDEDEIAFMTGHIPSLQQLHDQRKERPTDEPEQRPGLLDRAKAALGKPVHDAPRHDATPTAPPPGQGAASRLTPDEIATIAAAVAQMSAPAPTPTPSPNGQEAKPSHP